jgi:RHS repeat-associated protein
MLTDDGPFADDTVSYTYANRLRTGMSLLSSLSSVPWSVSYSYDEAKRLKSITSPAGTFGYGYSDGIQNLVSSIGLPRGSFITNTYDANARLLGTWLEKNDSTILNSHVYSYNQGNQRTQQVFTAANYVDYTYDPIGQLETAKGKESGGSSRLHEQMGYTYDAAGNLRYRTNNALIQNLGVNSLNELQSYSRNTTNALTVAGTTTSPATGVTVDSAAATLYGDATFAKDGFTPANGANTYTAVATDSYSRTSSDTINVYLPITNNFVYDLNGNLRTNGTRIFDYDDENELIRITEPGAWKSEFSYDGKLRRRTRKEFTWTGSWTQTNEVRYVYDGNLVLQERWLNLQLSTSNFQQLVTYTRGRDLSGSLEGAGGIGGLLARSDLSTINPFVYQPAYYHSDGNGNVTCLINSNQAIVAKYLYDPYGNILSISGPLAEPNLYRFSSKESHPNSALVCYLYRHYAADIQRWIACDPLLEPGFEARREEIAHRYLQPSGERSPDARLYTFVMNAPSQSFDPDGLTLKDIRDCFKKADREYWKCLSLGADKAKHFCSKCDDTGIPFIQIGCRIPVVWAAGKWNYACSVYGADVFALCLVGKR